MVNSDRRRLGLPRPIPRLILVFAGRSLILLVLSCRVSFPVDGSFGRRGNRTLIQSAPKRMQPFPHQLLYIKFDQDLPTDLWFI